MKAILLKKLLLAVLLSTALNVFAQDFEVDGFCYKITSSGEPYTVAVTCKREGYSTVEDYYFGTVTIPKSVVYNGKTYAVTSMEGTFDNSRFVTAINIPSTIQDIIMYDNYGNLCFDCISLVSINVDENNPNYCDIDGVLFSKDKSTLIAYPNAKSSVYIVPSTTLAIGERAFYHCSGINSITIPSSVTTIGECAFSNCINLETVNLFKGLKVIGGDAFEDCENLKRIDIPDGVVMIGGSAFESTKIESVRIPGTVKTLGAEKEDGYVFDDCVNLKTVILEEGLTFLGEGVFCDCESLKTITLPTSLEVIDGAFFGSGLTSIYLPEKVYEAEFNKCYFLTEILVDSDNQEYCSINGILFSKDKEGLLHYPWGRASEEYIIPEGTLDIRAEEFNCKNLKSIIFPSSLEYIHTKFRNCDNLMTIKCQALTPPVCDDYSFYSLKENTTIYVPVGTKELYVNANGWGKFSNIVEVSDFGIRNNKLLSENHHAVLGKTNAMNIAMENDSQITGLQCDIFLPEGVTVATVDGEYDVELSSRASNSHMVMSSPQIDGSVRIIAYSANLKSFAGENGNILKIAYNVSSDFVAGSVDVKNVVLTSPDGTEYEGEEFTIAMTSIPLGDANSDKKVNVTDVVNIANYALGMQLPSFVFSAADVTCDEVVNVSDIVGTTNIILGITLSPQSVSAKENSVKNLTVKSVNTSDRLYINDFVINSGESKEIAVHLDNSILYSALQFDLWLPEGLSIYSEDDEYIFDLSERKHRSHTIMSALQDNGAVRVLAYSNSSKDFTGNSGAIIYFTVVADESFNGTHNVKLENIVLTTSTTQEYNPENSIATVYDENSATGITTVTREEEPAVYFNLQGVKVENPINGIFIKKQGVKTEKVIIK